MGLVQQLVVGAGRDDAAPLHDGDAVGAAHGGGPVGDDQDGAPAHQGAQRLLDLGLGLRVGHGGGLVHEQDRGVQQDRPGDGDALLLPARQGGLPPQDGVVAAGQGHDLGVDAGRARGGAHLVVGGPGPAQGDVLAHGGAQQLGVLEDEGDGGVQGLLVHVAQVRPADAHRPGVGVGEAGDEGGQGGLARARRTEQRGDGAGLQVEGDAVDGEVVPVGEGDAVDLDAGAVGPLRRGGRGQDGGVEDLAQAQGGGAGDLVGPGDRHDGDERARQHQGDERGGQDLRQGDDAGVHEQGAAAEVDQEDDGDGHPRVGQARHGHERHRPVAVEAGEGVGGGEVGAVGAARPPEGLDHGDAGDELDHGGGHVRQLAVHLHGLGVHAPQGEGVGEHVQGDGRHGQQGQAPVDPERAGQQGQRGDDRVEPLDGPVGDDGVHGVGVVLDRLADAPGGGVGEPGQRGAGDARDDVAAQPVAQGQVGQVGDEQRQEVQEQAPGVGADEEHDDVAHGPPVRGRAGAVGGQEDVAQAHEGDVGGHGEQSRDDDERLADPQAGAHRGAQPLEGGLAGGGALLVRRGRRAVGTGVGPGSRVGPGGVGAAAGGAGADGGIGTSPGTGVGPCAGGAGGAIGPDGVRGVGRGGIGSGRGGHMVPLTQ